MQEKLWLHYKWPPTVPCQLEYPEIPVQRWLEDTALHQPDTPFILFDDTILTYRQVDEIANQVAHFLIDRGVQPGDRVALFLPNIPHFPIVFFGVLKAGAIAVPCNPQYTIRELHFQLWDTGARCLFVIDHPNIYPIACHALPDTAVETVVYCNVGRYLPLHKRVLGMLLGKIPHADSHEEQHFAFDQILSGRTRTQPSSELSPRDNLAVIQFTGGTTGEPKGVCLTHYNLVSNLINASEWVRLGDDAEHAEKLTVGGECFLGVLPWFHSYGMIMTLLAAVRLQSSIVCVPDPRAGDPPFTEILRLIEKHNVTVFNGVPTLFSAVINHPLVDAFDLTSLKMCGSGAMPLPVEMAHQFEARTGAILYEAYGLTETATMAHCNPTNRRDRKLGALGLPVPNTDVLLLDVETGQYEVAPGEDGEIAISGPQVMNSYWHRPADDMAVFREFDGKRYLLTGDIGCMDDEGFFWLRDRKKDMVIIGGYKAFPREIEEVLYEYPAVAQAAVIGVPDEHFGQALKAYIKLKDGETATRREIIQYCKEHLASYKVPRQIEFRDSLPTTSIGKVDKKVLKAENHNPIISTG